MGDSHLHNAFNTLAGIIRTVNHPERLQIIETLHQQPYLTISQISAKLNIHRSIISQHCKSLKEYEIIRPHSPEYPNKLMNNYPKLMQISKVFSTFTDI